ncbi:MAG: hypothetical protein INF91_05500, partial [Alphaproteobacteria bacterium]|nr:hypothetical protein [Alphaproteobacteria bacterium]
MSRAGVALRRMACALGLLALAACSGRAGGPEARDVQALVSPASAALPESRLLPPTVETYWAGTAQCLVPASQVDAAAAQALAVLERYSEPSSKQIAGLRLVQRPRVLVDALDELTSEVPAAELRRVAGDCPSVYCVMNRLFGQPQGLRILYLYVHYRYNASYLSDRSARRWSADELADLILAFEDMPDGVLPFYQQAYRPLLLAAKDGDIARMLPGATGTVVAISDASAKVGIRATGAWASFPQHTRRAAIFHELAHDFFRHQRQLIPADRLWMQATVADEAFRRTTGRATSSVSQYARSNLGDDFAESAVAYRYAPELIMKRAPNRARLIRTWLFDGLSYDSP